MHTSTGRCGGVREDHTGAVASLHTGTRIKVPKNGISIGKMELQR